MRRRPEVLAPAGSADCLPAAVAGGADAVYLGLRHFNARGRAENFRRGGLAYHVDWLRRHGVRTYVVMNTLVHDDEYAKALEIAATAADAGVDAVIIQDLGLWTVLAREFPRLKRHASTQMTVHDPQQVRVLAGLGAERVILARELSLPEVAECTRVAAEMGIETEHFVHGALCYAVSGQCLMSNFAGCRSANRGTCAQNCRFDYVSASTADAVGSAVGRSAPAAPADVVRGAVAPRSASGLRPSAPPGGSTSPSGSATDRGVPGSPDGRSPETLLSMRDFAAVAFIPALADAGVASLKIEGRLKGPEYVYTVSRIYREATEAWAEGRPFDADRARRQLRDVFARPFTDTPLQGDYGDAARMHRWEPDRDRQPDAELVRLDRVAGRAELLGVSVLAGQGFTYTYGMWNGGFLVTAADPAGPGRWRCKVRGDEDGPPLPEGTPLWRNIDHAARKAAVAAMATVPLPAAPEDAVLLDLAVSGRPEAPVRIRAATVDGRTIEILSEDPLQIARGTPLDAATVKDSLGAFGGTGFRLRHLELNLEGNCFLPASVLKRLRRQVVETLASQEPLAGPVRWSPPQPGTPRPRTAALWVAVGSLEAGRAALAAGAAQAWLQDPVLDIWGSTAPALDHSGFPAGGLWLRHPAEARTSPHLAALGLPVVAGHLGALAAAHYAGLRVVADHSLNCFGLPTLAALGALGAEAAIISLECSAREVARLAARLGNVSEATPSIGVCVHGRLPAMLTRQDHGLAAGASRSIRATGSDGGLPYDLQRRLGGGTVVWESRRLCAAEQAQMTARLVDGWLLELADLEPAAVAELVAAYAGLRDGARDPGAVREIAGRHAPEGLFSGHLVRGSRELDAVAARVEPE